MKTLIKGIIAIAALSGCIYLEYNDISSWLWFVFVGICLLMIPVSSSNK
jgi:hypothetical protein